MLMMNFSSFNSTKDQDLRVVEVGDRDLELLHRVWSNSNESRVLDVGEEGVLIPPSKNQPLHTLGAGLSGPSEGRIIRSGETPPQTRNIRQKIRPLSERRAELALDQLLGAGLSGPMRRPDYPAWGRKTAPVRIFR